MTNLITTLGVIKSQGPCESGWKKLCKSLGTTDPGTAVTLSQILDSNGVRDACWSLSRCWGYRDWCLLIADVIDLPKVRNHSCSAVRNMPDTIRGWYAGTVTDDQLAEEAAVAAGVAVVEEAVEAEAAALAAEALAAEAAAAVVALAAEALAAEVEEAVAAAAAEARQRNEKLMREFCGATQ